MDFVLSHWCASSPDEPPLVPQQRQGRPVFSSQVQVMQPSSQAGEDAPGEVRQEKAGERSVGMANIRYATATSRDAPLRPVFLQPLFPWIVSRGSLP